MKAMILAAGVGSRLRPLTNMVCKPMTPIINVPVMEHIIKLLKKHGVTDIVSNLYYLPGLVEGYFGDGSRLGVNISYSKEQELLGTAGGVKKVSDFFDDTFVVIAGDALTDIDLTDMYNFHKKNKSLATIALREMEEVNLYGVVITDKDGRIKSFQEKPSVEEALSKMVNTGIYMFEPELLDWIPNGEVYDFGRQLFPLLVEKEAPFYGYQMDGYWNDVGSLGVYKATHNDVLAGKVQVDFPGRALKERVWIGPGTEIHPTAEIKGPVVIGEKCVIGPNVKISGPTIIGNECLIGEGAILCEVVIWNEENIKPREVLEHCTVGAGHLIKSDVEILER